MWRFFEVLSFRAWRQYLSSIIVLSVATIFIFLQITGPIYLNHSLQIAANKTAAGADFIVLESVFPKDETAAKIAAFPGVKDVQTSRAAQLQAVSGQNAITASIFSDTPSIRNAVALTAGTMPSSPNQILLSHAAAKALNAAPRTKLQLLSEHDRQMQLTTVEVTGIFRRSPFIKEPQRFEIIAPILGQLLAHTSGNQTVSVNNSLEIVSENSDINTELAAQIAQLTQGQVLQKSDLQELEYHEQKESVDYLISAIRWLLNIPVVLCGFVLLMNLRKVMSERESMRKIFLLFGYSWRAIWLVMLGELLFFTIFASAFGIAIGRAISISSIAYLKNRAIGEFLADTLQPTFAQYFFTFSGTFFLAVSAAVFTAFYVRALSRETVFAPLVNAAITPLETFPLASINSSQKAEKATRKARTFHRVWQAFLTFLPFLRSNARRGRVEIFAFQILLTVLVIALGIYYVVIIPENLLRVAAISAALENIRYVTNIGLIVLIGVLILLFVQQISKTFFPRATQKVLRRKYQATQIPFPAPAELRFSTIFIAGIIAAILALSTTARIGDLSFGNTKMQDFPYHAFASFTDPKEQPLPELLQHHEYIFTHDAAQLTAPDSAATVHRAPQTKTAPNFAHPQEMQILQGFYTLGTVEKAVAIHSFSAHIFQDQETLIDNVQFFIADANLANFWQNNALHTETAFRPGTLVLPQSYAWIQPTTANTAGKIQLGKPNETGMWRGSKTFQLQFANVPVPLISPQDASELRDTWQKDFHPALADGATAATPNLATARADSPAAVFDCAREFSCATFWIKFTAFGAANLAESYRSLFDLSAAQDFLQSQFGGAPSGDGKQFGDAFAQLNFSLVTMPAPLLVHNRISSILTVALLIFTLCFTLLNSATVFFHTFTKARRTHQLAISLGISRLQLQRTLLHNALWLTLLSTVVGVCMGISIGIFISHQFNGALPLNYFHVIPWNLAGILVFFALLIVGVTLKIKLELARNQEAPISFGTDFQIACS